MSASNKSWLMLGGLALVVAVGVWATKQINVRPAPTAEIAPATVPTQANPASASRTHFPTILHAKPVTGVEPAASPRYAPRDAVTPVSDPERSPVQQREYPISTGTPADHVAPATEADTFGAGSPAFRAEPQGGLVPDAPSKPAEVTKAVATSLTYTTVEDDSFWNISKQQYGGEGKFFKALYYHNRNRVLRPDKIPAGLEIETPPLSELKRLYPDLCQPGKRD